MKINDDIPGERLTLHTKVIEPDAEASWLAASRSRMAARATAVIVWLRPLRNVTLPGVLILAGFAALIVPLLALALVLTAVLIPTGTWMVAPWLVRWCVGATLPRRRVQRIALSDAPSLLCFTPEVIEAHRGAFRSWSMATTDVTSVQLAARARGDGLALTLRLEAVGTRVVERFGVEALDREDEALDLAFRIARILRWRYYRTTSEALGLEVTLLSKIRRDTAHPFRAVVADSEAREVPRISEPARYHFRSADTRAHEALPTLEPYVPVHGVLDIDLWQPGNSVRTSAPPQRSFTRPLLALLYGIGTSGALMVLVYVVGFIFNHYFLLNHNEQRFLSVNMLSWLTIPSCLLGTLLAVFDGAKRGGGLTSQFSWSDETLTVVEDGRKKTIAFDALGELVLREAPGANGYYHHIVEARSPGEHDVLIFQSAPRQRFNEGLPPEVALTIELATALAIPWRWEVGD